MFAVTPGNPVEKRQAEQRCQDEENPVKRYREGKGRQQFRDDKKPGQRIDKRPLVSLIEQLARQARGTDSCNQQDKQLQQRWRQGGVKQPRCGQGDKQGRRNRSPEDKLPVIGLVGCRHLEPLEENDQRGDQHQLHQQQPALLFEKGRVELECRLDSLAGARQQVFIDLGEVVVTEQRMGVAFERILSQGGDIDIDIFPQAKNFFAQPGNLLLKLQQCGRLALRQAQRFGDGAAHLVKGLPRYFCAGFFQRFAP